MSKKMIVRMQRAEIAGPYINTRGFVPPKTLDEKNRTVQGVLATENPVMVFDRQALELIDEILLMDGCQLPPANDPDLPLVDSHNYQSVDDIKGSVRGVRIEGSSLIGDITISRAEEGIYQKISEGTIDDLSLGYAVDEDQSIRCSKNMRCAINGREYQAGPDRDLVIRQSWTPMEVSLVAIGADDDAEIRSKSNMGNNQPLKRSNAMPNEKPVIDTGTMAATEQPVVDLKSEIHAATKMERTRIEEIRSSVSALDLPEELASELISGGIGLPEARAKILARTAEERKKTKSINPGAGALAGAGSANGTFVSVDERDNMRTGALNSLMIRAGLPVDAKAQQNVAKSEFAGLSLMGLARMCLSKSGMQRAGWATSDAIADIVLARSMPEGLADFNFITGELVNKMMYMGWDSVETTYQYWVGTGSLADFKTSSIIKLSEFSDIEIIPENAAPKFGQLTDKRETVKLFTYGKLFSLTRQALINDDLNYFAQVPRKLGSAVRQCINRAAYAVLVNNPAMVEDGVALFHATHGNLAGSSTAISVTSLSAGRAAMKQQSTPTPDTVSKKVYLNIPPKFLITSTTKQTLAEQLVMSPTDPASSNANVRNPFNNLQVISDAVLDEASTTAWYLAASPAQIGTVSVYTLNGQQAPMIREMPNYIGQPLGINYEVVHDFAVVPGDFRGLYKNAGA